jgi:hypothetical protein
MPDPIKRHETMRAEMKPDLYGGKDCDQLVPRWDTYADGDKDSGMTREPLALEPRCFPPGTIVSVKEPCCPDCGETRSPIFPIPDQGPMYAGPCDCGFDWDTWVADNYS